MEYIPFHRYIRNTPSDTEVHAEHHLSQKEYLTNEKEYMNHTKLHKMKELRGKTGVLVGLDLPSAGGRTEAGVRSPHWGNCLSHI